MLRSFDFSFSMINLKKVLLKTNSKNSRVQKNIVRCLDDLGVNGAVTPLGEGIAGFKILLKSSDEKQIKTEILQINDHLCTDEYTHPFVKYPIVFENSLDIKGIKSHYNFIFNDIQEIMFPKSVKKRKYFTLKSLVKSCITATPWAFKLIKNQIFERDELKRRAEISRDGKDSRRKSCIETLSKKYTLEELEDAEISAKNQISHKRTAPVFFRIIILAVYLYLLPYIGINMTTLFTSLEKMLLFIPSTFLVLKVEDEIFKRFEYWNTLSINYEETCLFIIQEVIKKKKLIC
jgi:hypothetical protein